MRTQLYRLTKYRVSNVGNPAIVVYGEEIIIMTRKNLSWSTPTRSFPRKLSVFLFKLRIYFFAYLGKKRKHLRASRFSKRRAKRCFCLHVYSTCWCFHYIKSGLTVFFIFLICTSALFSFFSIHGKRLCSFISELKSWLCSGSIWKTNRGRETKPLDNTGVCKWVWFCQFNYA